MTKYRFKFSIIMAIYNVEEYLEESIKCIVEQNIGFKHNVELILVNDGSQDDSGEICLKYKELYPNNVVYIDKENGGVSSARNAGLSVARGKILNFLDPDDIIDRDTLKEVYNFYEENPGYFDVLAIPMQFFEGQTGQHPLNYKCSKKRIINLREEFKCIQLSSSSSFIRKEAVSGLLFDDRLDNLEDALFINKILISKMTLGVLNKQKYWYRRRATGTSASQGATNKSGWYTKTIEHFYKELIRYYTEEIGYIPKFIQYLLFYNIKWKLVTESVKGVLDEEQASNLKNGIEEVLQYIDTDIIIKSEVKIWYKVLALRIKNKQDDDNYLDILNFKSNAFIFENENKIWNVANSTVAVQIFSIENNKLNIEGYVDAPISPDLYEVIISCNGKNHVLDKIDRQDKDIISLDNIAFKRGGFTAQIDISDIKEKADLRIFLKVKETLVRPKIWIDNRFVRLFSFINKSYFEENGFTVVYINRTFSIIRSTFKVVVGREYRFLKELYNRKEYKSIAMRIFIQLMKKMKKKPIWVFMDRIDKADDNAEHLFKYANKIKDGVEKYFVLDGECPDYERLSKIGKVIPYNSKKHKMILLLADRMISSHTADFARNHFMSNGRYLKNLQTFKFTFLQHGITQNDVSRGLGKYNKNISLLVSAAKPEYKEFLSGKYYYDEDVIKLTGFPRFDNLKNSNKKQILIMPTWRQYLMCGIDFNKKERQYNPEFKKSQFFIQYNNLLNDKELIKAAKRYGYKIKFAIHPELRVQLNDFDLNKYVVLADYEESYQTMFNESSLLITDYSSVVFDFAYMKKPVIYFQFDRADFFGNHYKPGYFDYFEDGFGAVCETYDELQETICSSIKNKCKMEKKYQKRVDKFYKYTDKNNCKRVYEELINLK